VALLAAGVTSWAQHQGHDMQNMPGMNMSRAKARPRVKRKVRSKARPTMRRKRSARRTPKRHDMQGMNMNGMDMQGTHMPVKSPTPTPSPAAGQHQMETMPGMQMPAASPTPAPAASPQQMHMQNMPGMAMPTASPSPAPQASPSPGQKMDMTMPMNMPMNNPTPQASPDTSGSMGNMNMPGMTHGGHDKTQGMSGMDMSGTGSMNMGPLMVMSGSDMGVRVGSSDSNIMSMGAMGSGTAWQPSSGPMHMYHKVAGDWLLMFHYNLIAGLNRQGGPRGVTKFDSQNWFMPMAYHKLGRGTLQLRGMFSAEPFTFPPGGSPLLFQTGETYKGQPLIDKQHPHDLFMELSAQYTHPLGERGTWFTYFGYPGEPALGPVAFMHRMSA